jgi:hypothetical protein
MDTQTPIIKHGIPIAQYLACLLLMGWLMLATGCVQYGQTVMVSKGQAGGIVQLFRGDASFCKLTTTEGVELTPADMQAFQVYCGTTD